MSTPTYIPVMDWMKSHNFTQVSNVVRENENGYPYVTFINADNKAENVYFSKNQAPNYAAGDAIERGFFSGLQIVLTVNSSGELRTKLGSATGNRVDIGDLF